jgi:hypothetical protein
MAKRPSFKSQLVVFADYFDDRFENLFSGKVIIEIELPIKTNQTIYGDVLILNEILQANGQKPKKARIVINFDKNLKKDLRSYQTILLSYPNISCFLLEGKRYMSTLKKFNYVFEFLEQIRYFRNDLNSFDLGFFVKATPKTSKIKISFKKLEVVNSLDEFITLTWTETYRRFLSKFSI